MLLTCRYRYCQSFFPYVIGVVYSGMGPDFRVLVAKGRKEAQKYYLQYGVRIYTMTNSPNQWEKKEGK
jgi:20S proteasome alpha/beta subunit